MVCYYLNHDFMEDILKYRNSNKLYQFLIDEFDMKKIDERYDSKNFGNFCITLSSKEFLLSYTNDRSFLDIYISSKIDSSNAYPLSFLKNYLYNPTNLNNNDSSDNKSRIENLNDFLRKDFCKISELVNEDNYFETKREIDRLLKEQFFKIIPD